MTQLMGRLEKWLPRKKIHIFREEGLIKSSLPYYTLSLLTATGFLPKVNPFMIISIVYSLFPILDELFSLDQRNPTSSERKKLEEEDSYFRMALYSAMILSWGVHLKSIGNLAAMEIGWNNIGFLVGVIYIASNMFSVQFAVAHQIMHKPSKFYRILGTLHMVNLYYPHFTYHHLHRHHHEVATPLDPSTARKGQTVYEFIPRCIVNSWKGVYEDQLKLGKAFYNNHAILSIVGSLAYALFLYLTFNFQALVIHSLMAFGAIFYLEAINYIEHYGLMRRKLPNNQYEKVTILHSWNAPHRFTNYLLFKLQRHSDHHQNSSKPYQTLVSMEQSPFLPHGYNLMILMSFFPKVWFKIMDPLVEAYQKLNLQIKQKVDPIVKETAITETRKFLIEIAVSAFLLFVVSALGMM